MISSILCLKKVYCMPGMISGPLVIRMYILESLNMCLSYGCLGMCFYIPWKIFANMVSPAKMTTTARTASKFCARTRPECPDISFLDLRSWRVSGIIEPWSECLPERLEALGRLNYLEKRHQKQNVCCFPAIGKGPGTWARALP